MITFTNRIHIARRPASVFAYVADPSHLPDWNYYVERVTPLTDGPPRVGARYLQQRRTDHQVFEITDLQPASVLAFQTVDGQLPAFTRSVTLSPTPDRGGTVMTDDWQLDTGHQAVVQQLSRHLMQRGIQANLDKLKQLLETGRTTLQDGRTTSLTT